MLTISVVIPCYNRAGTIAQAVASALRQTQAALEVLVIDDGSTDASAEIAEAAGARVIRLAANGGNAKARNVGIRTASGDAVAWLDSDDYWQPNHLCTVSALLDVYPDAAIASTAIQYIGTRSGNWYGSVPEGSPTSVLRAAFHSTPIPMSTSLVRRDALVSVGGFDESERYAVDFDLWLRLARRYKFVAARELTASYCWHPDQISANPERQWEATYRFRKRVLDDIRSAGEHDLAAELDALFRQRWRDDVQHAWDSDRTLWLRRLLELAPLVPKLPLGLRLKWTLRARALAPVLETVRAFRARARPSRGSRAHI